jgi:DNA-binding transcriptional LysR family regulator
MEGQGGGRSPGDPRAEEEWSELALLAGGRASGEITIRRLRAFWAIAHSESLTRAAKTLGVAQPSLSQQLTSLENAVGVQLFERRSNRMELTETGAWLLRKSEPVLRSVQELEDGLAGGPARHTVRMAGVTSVMRVLVPPAIRRLEEAYPAIEYDIQELAPAEILELLYARRVNVGLLSASSVAEASAGFLQEPILEDPHVLAVPATLDLSGVHDPERDLDPAAAAVLNATIQFVFGTQHASRVQDWFDGFLPYNRLRARVRSFELALALVRAGLGVCIVPALSMLSAPATLDGVRLYRIDMEPRRIVAMTPSHYRRVEPYAAFIAALRAVAEQVALPPLAPPPPFVAARADALRPFAPAP